MVNDFYINNFYSKKLKFIKEESVNNFIFNQEYLLTLCVFIDTKELV